MRNKLFNTLLLLFALALVAPVGADAMWPFKKKKKPEKKEVLTPYQKLFKGKKVETQHGLMTVHKVEDKIYAEFPVSLLGKDMVMASVIENTSDNGEGAPGQLGGSDVRFRFEMVDSTIVARMQLISSPLNTSGDANIAAALNKSTMPGIFKSFKVLACTPDSSAVVINMKPFFLEGSAFTKPFPSTSANGYFGFVTRSHSLNSDKSSILELAVAPDNIGVREEVSYSVDHTLMSSYSMYENVPLTAVVHKMLYLLPEKPMRPRMADSRLGMQVQLKSDYASAGEQIKTLHYAKRWRIEPSDVEAYRAGKTVNPTKQIVFYVDSLMPTNWIPYIKAGAESWNKAFEKIGFSNVIAVKTFAESGDDFNAMSLDVSTIRYSACWMNSAQTTLHSDSRTGEILNASILLNANLISVQYADRVAATMASDPRVRTAVLPIDLQGEMIQAAVAQAVGVGLGLTANYGAAYAYPVESLRSVEFTQKYGLAPSIMTELVINSMATTDDVKKGICLVNKNPGTYDELVLKYLYKPIYVEKWTDEKETLDLWIREHTGDPHYMYVRKQPSFPADPREPRGGFGDDHLKVLEYTLPNIKEGYAHYFEWFARDDRNMYARQRARSGLKELLGNRIDNIFSYIGGMYLYDVRENDKVPSYVMVDAAKQREALQKGLELAKDLDWVDDVHAAEFGAEDKSADQIRMNIFNGIFNRLPYVEVCTDKFPDTAYTTDEYLNDVYQAVWKGTLENRVLTGLEKSIQTAFLSSIIATSSATSSIGSFKSSSVGFASEGRPEMMLKELRQAKAASAELQYEKVSAFKTIKSVNVDQTKVAAYYFDLVSRTKEMLEKAVRTAPAADRSHYELLLYRIDKATKID